MSRRRQYSCSAWLRATGAMLCLLCGSNLARSATYYFSTAGSDISGNGSLAKPWRSVNKFNQLTLQPGDSALFRAGDQFSGKLYLDASDGGLNANGQLIAPVKIGAYGATASATRAKFISPYGGEGFQAYNTGGIELSDLDFVSGGFNSSSRTNGVDFLLDALSTTARPRLDHIRVNNVSTQGFGMNGLRVWAHSELGYNDVQITDSEFSGSGYSGIYVGATQWHGKQHANVIIDRVASHNNPGFSSAALPYTGHGILLAQTDVGAIQNSVAYDNGKEFGNANIGMWTYQSNAVTIQGNLAFGNRSTGEYDGGAFDIDGGTTNSIVQYNRSYDNDGAGLLLAQFDNADPMSNNIFRYNLSVNDGGRNYGGITIFGHDGVDLAKSAVFHNNTIVVDKQVIPDTKGAVWFLGTNHDDLSFINNAFVALNGAKLIGGDTSASQSTFAGNAYWTDGGKIILEDRTYASVQNWANAASQEKVNGKFIGITGDPQFIDMESFQLQLGSALLSAGLVPGSAPWPSWVTDLGSRDLGGVSMYQSEAPEIGAREFLFADLDGNGQIDGADLAIWASVFGSTDGAARRADLDGDGDSDGADFLTWQRLFATGAHVMISSDAIPEPTAAAMLLPILFAVRTVRRRAV